ncbi:MAG: hypothetical protein Q6373_005905, partial [Candidatus Sigynarchaeota archaeon]
MTARAILDMDLPAQACIDDALGDLPPVRWKEWLDISTREEYEAEIERNMGYLNVDALGQMLPRSSTDPRAMAVDPDRYMESVPPGATSIACHTSGTSGGAVKWYPITRDIAARIWSPGMRAIYESSGMSSTATPVIFVPSRVAGDGIITRDGRRQLRLYSSEFSQRLVASSFHPSSYVLAGYKDAMAVPVVARLLELDRISILSAPSATILGWANENALAKGLVDSARRIDEASLEGEAAALARQLKRQDPVQVARQVQASLAIKLDGATIIFSTSTLTNNQWDKIRAFMKWKHGEERFTNLYVGSEMGPFAASIGLDRVGHVQCNQMRVLPLILPCIDSGKDRMLLSRGHPRAGRLLVTRAGIEGIHVNIDTGDY